MDGNTRLCTATSAAALKESFGSDGQPGSYTDIDHADAIVLVRTQHGGDADGVVDAHLGPPEARTRPCWSVSTRGRR